MNDLLKHLSIVAGLILIGGGAGYGVYQLQTLRGGKTVIADEQPQAGMEVSFDEMVRAIHQPAPSYEGSSIAGSYLSGQFAQHYHDWKTAGRYMDYILKKEPDNPALLKRAMVLAIGAGDYDRAMTFAHNIIENYESTNALSLMFLTAEAFRKQDYNAAATYIQTMPEGGLSAFIMPMLYSWSSASLGHYDVDDLQDNSIHLYHAILVSDFMDKKDNIKSMLKQALTLGELSPEDVERIADIYAHIGETKSAAALYEQAMRIESENETLLKKKEAAEKGESPEMFVRVETPAQGLGEAFYDMARLLSHDFSDESARVFARLALFLNPEDTHSRLLLADIAARNERYADAIALYKGIEPKDSDFLKARRSAADLLYEQGRSDDAIAELQLLVNDFNDLESLIQIGNIHRINENFKDAIKNYNMAINTLINTLGEVSEDYWYLYYVRGMALEQDGQWDKAEADLKAALNFQPDHPYVLNYLGYAWADQGNNLDKALKMIESAVTLRPNDGYITDSLGWVYYRMGRYKDAVPHLERAVELMPYDPTINDHLGDAYWKVGRTIEAEFQWIRAKNHSENEELILAIEQKLLEGLNDLKTVKQARSERNKSATEMQ
ncbi:MAG: tetratricopeptide repeat protein [Rhodospirillales bacterium]|nr:tetratricopeptide repeat protein [Alphaproteobacteria bacterium]USO04901.1 MAG: tetratricopeptide repeat protein [Rhodospirillales bacterium]